MFFILFIYNSMKALTVEWDNMPEGQEALSRFMEESGFIRIGAFDFLYSRDVIFIKDLINNWLTVINWLTVAIMILGFKNGRTHFAKNNLKTRIISWEFQQRSQVNTWTLIFSCLLLNWWHKRHTYGYKGFSFNSLALNWTFFFSHQVFCSYRIT